MTTLVFGVVDVPYSYEGVKPRKANKKGRSRARKRRSPDVVTTAQVAQILENRYGPMQAFYDQNQELIGNSLVHSLEGALEDLYAGAPVRDPYAEGAADVTAGYQQWLAQGEIESLGIEGIPTQAALERRSLRFKSGVGPAERPSLVDTGTYEGSARVWVE